MTGGVVRVKQVFLDGKGDVVVADVPAPTPTGCEVLVSVTHSLISSGTERSIVAAGGGGARAGGARVGPLKDLRRFSGLAGKAAAVAANEGLGALYEKAKAKLANPPGASLRSLGYSAAGVVVYVGKETVTAPGPGAGLRPGDCVACSGAGFANHAETVAVPANLVARLPDGVTAREGAFGGVGAIALQGLRRARPEIGEVVLVQGLGLIGMLVVQLARAAGCRVVGADPSPDRVAFAREKFGLEWAVTLSDRDLDPVVAAASAGMGVDAAIICAGTPASDPVNDAFRLTRKKGRVVVVGAVGLDLEREEFYRKELDLLMSCSAGPGRYDPSYEEKALDYPFAYVRWTEGRNMAAFLDLVAAKKVDVATLISRDFPVEEAAEAYHSLTNGAPDTLGVLLTYPRAQGPAGEEAGSPAGGRAGGPIVGGELGHEDSRPIDRPPMSRPRVFRTPIQVALIGAGNYATHVQLPALAAAGGYHLRAVASRRGVHAAETAFRFRADYSTTNYAEVLADPEVDLVIIATRHDLHASMAIAAAAAGKHVLVEKPLALTLTDCARVAEVVAQNGVTMVVGFNRRFAPLVAAARSVINRWEGPKVAVYRMNAENLPPGHWLNDPVEGGGRLLGEGVHCFDLLAWLLGEETARVTAVSGPSLGGQVRSSAVVTLEYEQGSIATVVYSSVGSPRFPKERIEVFGDGNVLVIDDFRELSLSSPAHGRGRAGTAAPGARVRLRRSDKGQRHQLVALREVLRGYAGPDPRIDAPAGARVAGPVGAGPKGISQAPFTRNPERWLNSAVRAASAHPDPGGLATAQDGTRATRVALDALTSMEKWSETECPTP